jgi:hypothetical protein
VRNLRLEGGQFALLRARILALAAASKVDFPAELILAQLLRVFAIAALLSEGRIAGAVVAAARGGLNDSQRRFDRTNEVGEETIGVLVVVNWSDCPKSSDLCGSE